MVLEHYRVAVFELTRQNIMLKRQLAAAEARLAQEDSVTKAQPSSSFDYSCARPAGNVATLDGAAKRPGAAWPAAGKGAPPARKIAQARFWSKVEHARFLEGVKRFGSQDAHSIAAHVGTRTVTQVRTHAQKYFLKLAKQQPPGDGAAAADGASAAAAAESVEGGDAWDGSDDDGADA
jgi:SHAQKYF class myb-like DNA-binding protein